ncbi:RNA polymerase sigma factor [Actinomadura rayongensis]|uniref:RNA polymerase sigma factor n=1 Tax=Actinomadura rayongensis TaxID=1429076 RepID=UPI001F02410C|nr:sigma-70 family RNA polymerase sigma factor [Actinomadura rayongensis]
MTRPAVPPSALTELYRDHRVEFVRIGMLLVGDRATAEDVLHDVFLRMQLRPPHLADDTKLLAYARAAILNGCRMALRRRRLIRRLSEPHRPPVWSAESAVILDEDRRTVLRALHRLPRRQREALVLRYYLELSDQESAEAMGVKAGTVRSTVARALAALGRELGEEG